MKLSKTIKRVVLSTQSDYSFFICNLLRSGDEAWLAAGHLGLQLKMISIINSIIIFIILQSSLLFKL